MKKFTPYLLVLLIINACNSGNYDFENAIKSINTNDLEEYVSVVGSDRFMGRAPFTEGETLTTEYLSGRLEAIGFEPVFNGSYFQEVPLSEINSSINSVTITKSSKEIFSFNVPDKVTVISPQLKETVEIVNSKMIFAGFGIVAPEYGWDDYAGLDVKGKTVVVLVNDPGLYTGDTLLFKGREMTYYGRWTYKYEEAARQGAAGILIIHETEGAGYGYNVPRKSAMTPNFYLQSADSNRSLCQFTGWFSAVAADALFEYCGYNVSRLRMDACNSEFTGFDLKTNISMTIHNSIRYNKSLNIAGILRGSENPDECIVYSAHWDHLGVGEAENGD